MKTGPVKIKARSSASRGEKVSSALPIKLSPQTYEPVVPAARPVENVLESASEKSGHPKCILIVEDEADCARFIQIRLEAAGFSVLLAADGLAALEQARVERPDLILLDLGLPKLPGEEVCKAIREDQDEAISDIPIIMTTGKARLSDRIVGKVIGANAYLTKPLDGSELLGTISKLLAASE